jgi:hypothetical protein
MEAQNKHSADQAPVYLMSSVRAKAEQASAEEGATLNEFVNVAVAEKLAHRAHIEWLKRREVLTEEGRLDALNLLRRPDSRPPDPGDELPEGWPSLLDL